jgi:hypothetical protein
VTNLRPRVTELALDHKRDPYDLLELFDERAGIRQHDGGMRQDMAERMALEDVKRHVGVR